MEREVHLECGLSPLQCFGLGRIAFGSVRWLQNELGPGCWVTKDLTLPAVAAGTILQSLALKRQV